MIKTGSARLRFGDGTAKRAGYFENVNELGLTEPLVHNYTYVTSVFQLLEGRRVI